MVSGANTSMAMSQQYAGKATPGLQVRAVAREPVHEQQRRPVARIDPGMELESPVRTAEAMGVERRHILSPFAWAGQKPKVAVAKTWRGLP